MRILSVLVNEDSFYYAIIKYNANKYELIDIDYACFDFLSKSDKSNNIPKTRSGQLFTDYARDWNIDKIVISLADSFTDFAQIPNVDNDSYELTEEFIKLYVSQVYHSDDIIDFEIESAKYKLTDVKNSFITTYIRSNLYFDILKTLGLKNFPIIKAGTNFFNSVRAFEYNYSIPPESRNLLISLQKNSVISAVIKNKILYNFAISSTENDGSFDLEDIIRKLPEKYDHIDGVFLFGNIVNKSRLELVGKTFDQAQIVVRLGAFDNLLHILDERHLEFAGRMFHNYTGVVGSTIESPKSSIIRSHN